MITLFPSRCYNGGKQHRFQPRVTKQKIPGEMLQGYHGPLGGAIALIEAQATIKQTYFGDVCTWCGAVVNQPSTKGTSP